VSAGSLSPGTYGFPLSGSAFGGAYNFSGTVIVTIELPYFRIQSQLGGVIDIEGASTKQGLDVSTPKSTDNDSQFWALVPDPAGSGCYYIVSKLNGNVIDIEGASTASGALLNAFPRKLAADGFSGSENELWYFVSDPDPGGSGYCFIVSKLNGNVIDIQGGSNAPGTLLDAYPVKLTEYENQLWTVVDGNFPSVLPTVQAPGLRLGGGFRNYLLESGGDTLTGVSVTVSFQDDFVSSANGYSFQLNCNSTEGFTTVWQQFIIYASPGSNQLVASVQTWSGPSVLNNIHVPLANLPSPTIPKGYKFNIALTYWQEPQYQYTDQYTAIVSGAVFTVTDNTGKTLPSVTITIIGNNLASTNAPATLANLAPIAALQLNIGGWENNTMATLTGGAGKITYVAGVGLTAVWARPSYINDVDKGTAENANVVFGPLPWPWSSSMETLEPGVVVEQLFKAVSGSVLGP